MHNTMSPLSIYVPKEPYKNLVANFLLFNSSLTYSIFIWETRLGKRKFQDRSTDPCSEHNGEQNQAC